MVIQHYDARNDVRELVELLAAKHDVVLFADERMLRGVLAPCEKRPFKQRLRPSDRFWLQAWNFFGELPASRNNFLVTELFKLAPLSHARRAIAFARLWLRMRLPSLMSFDFLLDRLVGSDMTPVDDIDRFLVITELSSPRFLSRALRAGKRVDAYVYSWDHACKHATFSTRVYRWLVWHDGITDDLVDLQRLPRERIFAVGSTQLAYIYEYLGDPELRERRVPQRYVYYGCGVGYPEMARQEARLIGLVAEALQDVAPDVALVVRPYPMLAETDFFETLHKRPNLRFDDDYRSGRKDRSLSREAIFERLNLQEHAEAFVHCGTTMGLEGAYFDSPVLFLDLEDFDYADEKGGFTDLRRFIHQYHNERYMIRDGYPNVVRRSRHLSATLSSLLADPNRFRAYNRSLAADIPLRALTDVVDRLVDGA